VIVASYRGRAGRKRRKPRSCCPAGPASGRPGPHNRAATELRLIRRRQTEGNRCGSQEPTKDDGPQQLVFVQKRACIAMQPLHSASGALHQTCWGHMPRELQPPMCGVFFEVQVGMTVVWEAEAGRTVALGLAGPLSAMSRDLWIARLCAAVLGPPLRPTCTGSNRILGRIGPMVLQAM
jgi:hypothetical protein